ncbi:transcription elongation factor spt5 [Coemansia sp. RSA 1939]|nr:transcription elongation factor spt5 [Coemansia sp. RSA 1939]KAJ2614484.1 transcription elongation factor spt5 [Coemansia sp. RSA 1804]
MSDGVEDMFGDQRSSGQRRRQQQQQQRGRKYSDDEDGGESQRNAGSRRGRQQHSEDEDEEDEEDAGDYDEEDEEDEEEEEYAGRKKGASEKGGRRKRPRTHNFLDIEASVDTDEEEEDDDEGALGDFIVDNEAELASAEKDALRHRSAMRPPVFHDEATLDADAIEAQLRERYSGYAAASSAGRGAAAGAQAGADADWVPQRLIIPGIDDPHLWMARCAHGKERDAALAAARRVLESQRGGGVRSSSPRFKNVFSVFCRDGLPGYLYVEARSQADVQAALDGIPGVYSHKLMLVPIGDMVDVVKVKARVARINPGAWVRVKRGNYAGDLAQVVSVLEAADTVEVRMLPRLDYGGEGRSVGGRGALRPPQRLFSVEEAQRADARTLTSRQNEILWKGDRFVGGYLHRDIRAASLQTEAVGATLEEIAKFAAGEAGDDGDEQAAIAALASQAAAAALSGAAADGIEEANGLSGGDLVPGERVEVVEGDLAGVAGVVRSVENNSVVRVVPDLGALARGSSSSGGGGAMSFPARHLRKRFALGDHVRVLSGRHRGATGMVLDVADAVVTLQTDVERSEVRALTKDLRITSDVGTAAAAAPGAGALVGLDIHDLVHLEGKQMGVVLKAGRDSLTVLDDHNSVRTVTPAAVRPAGSRFERSGVDAAGNTVRRGDSVREVGGARRQGAVLQVTRFVTYVQPRDQAAASSVFACRTRQIESLSARQHSVLDPYATRRLRTSASAGAGGSQNGRGRGGGAGRVGVLRGGRRDPLVGRTVIACRGPYKGYMGLAKEVAGGVVRVELQTNSRVVSIEKDKLNVRMPSGEVVAAAEYGMPGAGGGGSSGHMAGAAAGGYGGSGAGGSAWGAPSPMPSARGYAYGDARSTPSAAAAAAAAASPAPFGAWDAAPSAAASASAGAGSTGGWDTGSAAAAGGGWDAGSAAPGGGADGWRAPAAAASAASAGGWGATPGPATPGGLPQTPGGPSLPQTPGAWGAPDTSSSSSSSAAATPAAADNNPGGGGGGFFAWAVPRAMVVLASGQRGTIREVARERQQAIVQLEASAATQVIDRASVARLDPRPVRAEKRDRVIVIRGARRGALGTMVGKDGAEAFFQPDGDAAWHSEPLRNLAVYGGGKY